MYFSKVYFAINVIKFHFNVLKKKYTNSEILKVVLHCTYKKCTLL